MNYNYDIPPVVQFIVGMIIFGIIIWLLMNKNSTQNYDDPNINVGYCNSRECW
ncbi:MAG: hypothetical protein AAB334_01550 [Patescibacteria group bacterium]